MLPVLKTLATVPSLPLSSKTSQPIRSNAGNSHQFIRERAGGFAGIDAFELDENFSADMLNVVNLHGFFADGNFVQIVETPFKICERNNFQRTVEPARFTYPPYDYFNHGLQ